MTSTRQHHADALASELAAADGDNNADAVALERGTPVMTSPERAGSRSQFPDECCTRREAWGWVNAVAVSALEGDEDLQRVLPSVIEHWLLRCGSRVASR